MASDFKCTTANAMFAGLTWLANRQGFTLAIVSEIGGERVCAFELCGSGLIVLQNPNASLTDSWVLKMTSAKDCYPYDPEAFSLTAKFFQGAYSTEGSLLNIAMLLELLRIWGQEERDGLLDIARKAEHMFGGF